MFVKLFVLCCILFDKHFYFIVVQLVNHSLDGLNEVDLLLVQIFHCLLNVTKSFHFAPQKVAGPERRSQAIISVLSAREHWSVLVISAAVIYRTGLGALSCASLCSFVFVLAPPSSIFTLVYDGASFPHTQLVPVAGVSPSLCC